MSETPFLNIIENIKKWPLSRKLALGVTALLSLLLFGLIIFHTNRDEYRPLYTGLPQEEAASVTSWLKEQEIPYQLKNDGRSIYVPSGDVYETRLNLAGAGLPKQGGVGFEIFDNQSFGMTQFTQKINFQRALQGELARTISALGAVKSARVHLVIPENRLLREQQKEPKASVVIELAAGGNLDATQIQGIVHLVAGSIEGLKKESVTVVDTSGRILSQGSGTEPGLIMLPDTLKFKETVETRLESRAQSLLDQALGQGNSIVRVTTELDFTEEAITSEEYDPKSQVPRSEQVSKSESGAPQSSGVPGVASNLGGSPAAGGSIPTSQSSETTNYEISKTIKQIKSPVGKLKSISAAVLVAEKFKPGVAGGAGTHTPLSAEEIESIRKMVVSALGIEADRGDRIEVVSMPFKKDLLEVGGSDPGPGFSQYLPYVKYLVLLICAGLLYLVLLRPMLKTLRGESVQHNKTVGELEDQFAGERKVIDHTARLRRELADFSVTPTQVVKTWLKEG